MSPDPRFLLADVDRAGEDIAHFTEGMDCETRIGDSRTQAAVERKFEIIGEALNRLHRTCPEIAGRIHPLRKVVDFRDLRIHGHAMVMPDRVWNHAVKDLPEWNRRRSERLWMAFRIG